MFWKHRGDSGSGAQCSQRKAHQAENLLFFLQAGHAEGRGNYELRVPGPPIGHWVQNVMAGKVVRKLGDR
jgi:hypothetical protein